MKTSADFVVPIPDSIDDFTAAQMYINPLTAWVTCTETLNLQHNDVLLVNACDPQLVIFCAVITNFKLPTHCRDKK